jgi:N5-(carboxyethyl)ornithine synthase
MATRQTIGFFKSHKENEHRIALLPQELAQVKHPECVYLEQGYGDFLGISDASYEALGAHIVSRQIALEQTIVCEPKIGDSAILAGLKSHQTVFGWIHAK